MQSIDPWHDFHWHFLSSFFPSHIHALQICSFTIMYKEPSTQDFLSTAFTSPYFPHPCSVHPQIQSLYMVLHSEHPRALRCFADYFALQKIKKSWGKTFKRVFQVVFPLTTVWNWVYSLEHKAKRSVNYSLFLIVCCICLCVLFIHILCNVLVYCKILDDDIFNSFLLWAILSFS